MAYTEYSFDHVAQVVPDIAAAVEWYRETLPGAVRVIYQDATWALIEAGGTRVAFVVADQHPGHLAWRVSNRELERLAERYNKEIKPHRDKTRSFYLEGPGGVSVEIIAVENSDYERMLSEAETT